MKYCTSIVLFIFILFLSTPTLVTMIEKDMDTSMFYCFAEEEHAKVVKADVKTYVDNNVLIFVDTESTASFFDKNSQHPTIFREIFSPPPNFI